MRALCAFELALVPGHRRCRSRVLLLTDVVLLRHLRRSEDVLLSLIHSPEPTRHRIAPARLQPSSSCLENEKARVAGPLSKRMMGLEPTTFCRELHGKRIAPLRLLTFDATDCPLVQRFSSTLVGVC